MNIYEAVSHLIAGHADVTRRPSGKTVWRSKWGVLVELSQTGKTQRAGFRDSDVLADDWEIVRAAELAQGSEPQ